MLGHLKLPCMIQHHTWLLDLSTCKWFASMQHALMNVDKGTHLLHCFLTFLFLSMPFLSGLQVAVMQSNMKPSEQTDAHGFTADAASAIRKDAMSTNTSTHHVSVRKTSQVTMFS